jgi:hypothetical protein
MRSQAARAERLTGDWKTPLPLLAGEEGAQPRKGWEGEGGSE